MDKNEAPGRKSGNESLIDVKKPSILLAEPHASVRNTVERALSEQNFELIPVSGALLARQAQKREFEMGIIGPSLADVGNLRRLGEQMREYSVRIPLLLLVTRSSEELAIAALRAGIDEYLGYPCGAPELNSAAHQCLLRSMRWQHGGRQLSPPGRPSSMIGESRAMQDVKAYLSRAASTDSNVLITGETGTGKELAAEFVHRHSRRRNKPFITVNCAAIPDSLLESELFGYEKGAFTGAQSSRDGRLKAADGGTIFLDEIGDMSAYAQAKILRAIESKEIQRLGGSGESVDVRIIAATNQDLETLVRAHQFRKDLYFRLNVARVHLPPLRERKEDIPSLVSFYLHEFSSRAGNRVLRLTDSAWKCFLAYEWEGNIRELKNSVEAILIETPGEEVSPEHLPRAIREHCGRPRETVDADRDRLVSALVSTNWNKSKAADKLLWSRMTLYRKMVKYGVAGPTPQSIRGVEE